MMKWGGTILSETLQVVTSCLFYKFLEPTFHKDIFDHNLRMCEYIIHTATVMIINVWAGNKAQTGTLIIIQEKILHVLKEYA